MSRLVLVTGPIAGGKSTACRYLSSKGYPVYECDSRAKELYREVDGLLERVEKILGCPLEQASGVIFSSHDKLLAVENELFPHLLADLQAWRARNSSSPVLVVESATALSKPVFNKLFDTVILIVSPYDTRSARDARVCQRDSLQAFDESKADYVITNDSTLDELYKQIDKIL